MNFATVMGIAKYSRGSILLVNLYANTEYTKQTKALGTKVQY